MRKRIALTIAAVLGLALACQAQFIGYTSPQTVSQILATNVACTGGVQTFPVSNFAQSSHVVNFTSANLLGLQVTITGSWDGVNFLGFSDVAFDTSGQLQATGYYPALAVRAVCPTAAGTFSLQYSGTSSYQFQPVGFVDRVSYSKLLATNFPANASSASLTVTVPYGSSAGLLYFQYNGTGSPVGSTFTLTSSADATQNGTLLNAVPLQANQSLQTFLIPALPTSQLNFTYTTGGASATNYTVQILFFKPGMQIASGDPCQAQWGFASKVGTPITAPAAATTQILAAPAVGLSNYVCGYQISQAVFAGTVQWISGTGANCGTGTTSLTGSMQTIVGQPFTYSGPGWVLKAPAGNAICLVTTGAGATVAGVVTSVVSP